MQNNRRDSPTRRQWIKQVLPLSLGALLAPVGFSKSATLVSTARNNLKLSLNAYSFNSALIKQELSLQELFDFCASSGFQAVDLTAYYLSGYPNVPEDGYLYEVKKDAHRYGLHISGTGVRNDFTHLAYDRRKAEVQLVKDWGKAASFPSAPVYLIYQMKNL